MASETRTRSRPFPPAQVWPSHDTEESILGTDLHQTTITNLRLGINEVAHRSLVHGQSAPWQALTQMVLLGCERRDGSLIRTYPDVFVYRHCIDPNRGSVTLAADGPPLLIVEVLSDSTFESDLDLELGKGYSYAHAGVGEYLALDPTRSFVPEGIRAWRLEDGRYRRWEPDKDGRWQSAEIDVAIGIAGALATVYTDEGRRMLHEGEIEQALAQRDTELERLRRLLDERRQQ